MAARLCSSHVRGPPFAPAGKSSWPAGVQSVSSTWGGAFDDDPGGLALRHEKSGLLSAANSGPDSNSGHFSIVVSPAPHLDGGYTIFGEVTSGFDTMWAVNKLAPPGSTRPTGTAVVTKAGCVQNCNPRPEVKPKCSSRDTATSSVQGRSMHKCLD